MEECKRFTLPSGFVFDVSRLVGEGRIDAEELEQLKERVQQAAEGLAQLRQAGLAKGHLSKDGSPEPVYYAWLPYVAEGHPNTPELLRKLKDFGRGGRQKYDAVVFCGVGGSYLGGKVLYDCHASAYWPREEKGREPEIFFSGNNLDAEDLERVYERLVLAARLLQVTEHRAYRVLLLPISKSGTTLETTAAFLHFWAALHREAQLFQVGGAVVTDARAANGPLNRLAAEHQWPLFDVPEGVGGRFSVLSTPGLLTAAVLGMNLEKLLQGARDMDQWCQKSTVWDNPALCNAVLKYAAAKNHGCPVEIFMPYVMRLKALGEWYVQLLSESLGKRQNRNGETVFYGRTPVVAIGTTDMHAQTQLHQDGRRDKVVQFLFVENRQDKIALHNPFPEIPEYNRYEGLDVGKALKAALEANQEALAGDNRPSGLISLPLLNEYYLGQLFYFLMLSIGYEGELANVDAYDQPGVEVYKKLMQGKLVPPLQAAKPEPS